MAKAQAQDFNAVMKDIMGAFPVDTKAMDEAFKTTATLNEKLSAVSVDAAEKSAELSAVWAKDTLAKFADFAKVKAEPADYAKAMTDMASSSAEAAAELIPKPPSPSAGTWIVIEISFNFETFQKYKSLD